MAIILDTDVIIRGEKGTFDLHGWLTLHATEEIEIAAITVAELWHGVELCRDRTSVAELVKPEIRQLPCPLPLRRG